MNGRAVREHAKLSVAGVVDLVHAEEAADSVHTLLIGWVKPYRDKRRRNRNRRIHRPRGQH